MDDPLQDAILSKMHEVGGKKYMTISATIISRELAEMMRAAELKAARAVLHHLALMPAISTHSLDFDDAALRAIIEKAKRGEK